MQREPMAFDRSDHSALRVLLWLAAGFVTLGTVVAPAWSWVTGRPVQISYEGHATSAKPLGPDLRVAQPADLTLDVRDPSTVDRIMSCAPGLITLAATLVVVVLFRRMLRDLDAGDPFREVNVRRLRAVALTIGACGIAASLLTSVVDSALLARHSPEDVIKLTWQLPGWPLVTMLLVAAVAQAFAVGARMRDDVSGLV